MPAPHPIAYQGSKRRLAAAILRHCPPRFQRLVEPFARSAAVTLAAAHANWAERFLINDAHRPLANLWRRIVADPSGLATEYATMWHEQTGDERRYFDRVREEFNRAPRPAQLLFLLARCVKAAVRYNKAGEFNNSPDNRRRGTRPEAMRRHVERASRLLAGRTVIADDDYATVLEGCDRHDLIYLDPPYQGVSSSRNPRYAPGILRDDFCAALEKLNRRSCLYLVSYDGRTGAKTYGEPLPQELNLVRVELPAGRSSQGTLLGRREQTFESLYISPALARATL